MDACAAGHNIAVIHAKSDRMEEAVREANQAVILDPDNRVARENLMNFRRLLEKK